MAVTRLIVPVFRLVKYTKFLNITRIQTYPKLLSATVETDFIIKSEL